MREPSRQIDAGQTLRYSAETQDEAYRTGAYDFVEELAMAPRLGAIAAYVQHLGVRRVLDLGCGTGLLLAYLPPAVGYVGIDISPTAIESARARFQGRPHTSFHTGGFRDWHSPEDNIDCLIWAGIGRTWTRGGRKGRFEDWLEILDLAEGVLTPDAYILLEMVVPHWASMAPLVADRYDDLAGCVIDHEVDDHRAQRAIRVLRRRTAS